MFYSCLFSRYDMPTKNLRTENNQCENRTKELYSLPCGAVTTLFVIWIQNSFNSMAATLKSHF